MRGKNKEMNDNKIQIKRAAALIALILIGCVLLMLIAGALMHNTGMILTSLFLLIVVPVLIYLFLRLASILKTHRPEEKDL
jgi:4-hydroxybenzoate polyprenyltransferase